MKYTLDSSAMNSAKPMPTGARKVPLCFSAASMKIVKISMAVVNISMTAPRSASAISLAFAKIYSQTPCAIDVFPPSVVLTFIGPGNNAETSPALAILPKSCATTTTPALTHLTAPMSAIPSVTAGLNNPPLTLKNTHALTARLNPNTKLMYSSVLALGIWLKPPCCVSAPEAAALATWVPLKAKKRKRKVPTNSPMKAMMWLRSLLGRKPMPGMRSSFLCGCLERWIFLRKGRLKRRSPWLSKFILGGPLG